MIVFLGLAFSFFVNPSWSGFLLSPVYLVIINTLQLCLEYNKPGLGSGRVIGT